MNDGPENTRRARGPRRVGLEELSSYTVIPLHSSGSVPSVADVFGVGRNSAYAMAKRGEVPTLRIGGRVVVPVPALLRLLGADVAMTGGSHER